MEEKFVYADRLAQVKKVNKTLLIGYALFYLFDFILVLVAALRGIRTMPFAITASVLMLIAMVANVVEYKREAHSEKLRYIAVIGLLVVSFLVAYAFDNSYVRFFAIVPLIGSIVYYDGRFTIISATAMGIENIIITVLKAATGIVAADKLVDDTCATVIAIFMLVFICITERVGKRFNTHTLGKIEEEKQHQETMLKDVIEVAMEVQKGTKDAMDLVNQLNDSTGVVTGAVKDIADSTQNTAENIQEQTVMTQNIQEAIEQTIARSENMVKIAGKSSDLNKQNIEIMNNLKEQSATISQTNANVGEIMKSLQERADAVNGIADTIFAISSQTNLLALNASIESARAGEAGRGFAVVADEIRQLAEKTRTETETIASILGELSTNAKEAVEAVEQSVVATDAQEKLINTAAESFDDMNANVTELTSDISEIDKMLMGLSEANNQIVDSITQLSATTEEVTASSSQAEGLSSQNLENADNTKELLSNVLDVSYKLEKYTN